MISYKNSSKLYLFINNKWVKVAPCIYNLQDILYTANGEIFYDSEGNAIVFGGLNNAAIVGMATAGVSIVGKKESSGDKWIKYIPYIGFNR